MTFSQMRSGSLQPSHPGLPVPSERDSVCWPGGLLPILSSFGDVVSASASDGASICRCNRLYMHEDDSVTIMLYLVCFLHRSDPLVNRLNEFYELS